MNRENENGVKLVNDSLERSDINIDISDEIRKSALDNVKDFFESCEKYNKKICSEFIKRTVFINSEWCLGYDEK